MMENDKNNTKTNKWEKLAEDAQAEDVSVLDTSDTVISADSEEDLVSEDAESDANDAASAQADASLPGADLALQAKILGLEEAVSKHKEAVLRAKAEVANIQNIAQRDVAQARKFGAERLLKDMLPVGDSLIRALEGVSTEDEALLPVREGMSMTLDLLEKTLEKHGVATISPEVGEVFDPNRHEAMSLLSSPDAEKNTVLQLLQKGYSLNGRILRAAMVIVAS
jgi:molecular chaperone GrpE